jgi:hypothetical protein
MTAVFPARFSTLDRFASWALPQEAERHKKKSAATMAEVREFYDAVLPLLPQVLEYLNEFDVSALPPREQRLLELCLAMVEAAMSIEMFNEVNPKYLMPLDRFVPAHDAWTR